MSTYSPCLIPTNVLYVHKDSHQLSNGQSWMSVIQLNGNLCVCVCVCVRACVCACASVSVMHLCMSHTFAFVCESIHALPNLMVCVHVGYTCTYIHAYTMHT